ncbi:MAG: hypothetical protein LQ340_005779 [Diploschistes diacapsis]|nr:MAG: hypothetical protein LQ340_005779 [Diploschistes diacapsis]
MNLERDWFKTQLLEPELLQELQDRYTQFLGQSLAWKDLSTLYIVSSNSAMNFKTVSLKGFARHTVSYCSTSTFFGRALLRVASSFGQDYQDFEEESWKIFYRLPWFLARSSHAAKAKALDGLERYLLLPEEERSELAWLFQTMNTELRYLSVPPRDVAGITMIIIWAINNNAHKIAFWIFAHLLHDPPLLAALRAETDAACLPSGAIDVSVLLTASPHLDAVWYETLRMYNATSAFHLNGVIFGTDAQAFNARRFLENKSLPRTKGYAPFGGGHTYRPGRLFAQREIYLFVAMTLWQFELELEPREAPHRMPKVDKNLPSAAAMGPAEDVLVRMQPRVH